MPIRVLSEAVSSAIAAGEVVERPSSIVKELIENSLDAASTTLQVQIKDGGKSLVQVADNGSGIPRSEVRLAIERFPCDVKPSQRGLGPCRIRVEGQDNIPAVSLQRT